MALCKEILCKSPNYLWSSSVFSERGRAFEAEIDWYHGAGLEGQKCTSLGWSRGSKSIKGKKAATANIADSQDPNRFEWQSCLFFFFVLN